jgi:hypothetical protein
MSQRSEFSTPTRERRRSRKFAVGGSLAAAVLSLTATTACHHEKPVDDSGVEQDNSRLVFGGLDCMTPETRAENDAYAKRVISGYIEDIERQAASDTLASSGWVMLDGSSLDLASRVYDDYSDSQEAEAYRNRRISFYAYRRQDDVRLSVEWHTYKDFVDNESGRSWTQSHGDSLGAWVFEKRKTSDVPTTPKEVKEFISDPDTHFIDAWLVAGDKDDYSYSLHFERLYAKDNLPNCTPEELAADRELLQAVVEVSL